jgi:hypothetical protein
MIVRARFRSVVAAALVAASVASEAWSQDTATEAPPRAGQRVETPQEHLTNYIHYAIIAQVELANANAQLLLDSGITNAELATLLDETKDMEKRFSQAIERAMMVPELQANATELARRAEAGRLDLARDEKRINEAVQMLVGTVRQKQIAKARLLAAKEYAVPALLKEITEGKNQQLNLVCQQVLIDLGASAAAPLNVALLNLTGGPQRLVADILGNIKQPLSAPYLREVSLNAPEQETKDAAKRAFDRLGVPDAPLSTLYSNLARNYFDGHESLVAFADETTNNVWRYNNFTGLSPMPVPTPIFTEVMAMELAAKAVELGSANSNGLSLFVASDLKRENDLPEGAADPIYGDNKYTPDFYATIFGPQTCLDVLGLALDKLDTALVRDAINALSKTTGGSSLFARSSGRQPLLEALSYPDRRVQYEAALVLAHALPQQHFSGDTAVVPTLASAVRQGGKAMAVVVMDNDENRSNATAQLEKMGFMIVAAGQNASAIGNDISRAVGADLVLIRMGSAADAKGAIESLRRNPKVAAAPITVIAGAADESILKKEYRNDSRIAFTQAREGEEALQGTIESVMKTGAGGRITEDESEEYAIRSLAALRDIAISRSPAYSIADAQAALIDALNLRQGGTRLLVADILALIDADSAQRSLFDAAFNATAEEQVALLERVAMSVRLFGDKAEERHVAALVDLIANSSGDTAEAAATVHGALNLSNTQAVGLLPKPQG